MECSGLRSNNPPVITISCQAGGSRRKWQPSPFALSYFLPVVWKLLWILLKTPLPSRRKKSGKKLKVRKKVEKGKIAKHEIRIELFGLRTITIKIKSAIIVFFSFFLLSFSSLLLFLPFFSFARVVFRSYWTEKNRLWPFSTQMAAKISLSKILLDFDTS